MDELLRLLREFGADDALISLVERFAATDGEPLSDEDLDTMLSGLVAFAEEDEASAALLGECADAATAVRAEQASRDEQAAAEEAERQAAAARLRGEDPEANADADGDDGDEDSDDDADGDDGEGETAETGDETPTEGETADQPEPVAASGSRPNRAARRSLARRTPRDAQPVETEAGLRISFAADVPGIAAGSPADDLRSVNRALYRRAGAFRRSKAKGLDYIPVATIRRDIDDERMLVDGRGRALSAEDAAERVEAVIAAAVSAYRSGGQQALTAAGGLCAPLAPVYTVDVLGEQGRPIRDTALVSFGVTRGGLISVAPPTLAQVAAQSPNSVGVWTVADDESATDGTPTKSIARIECTSNRETEIEAITMRVIIGNMLARTFGEYVDAWSELTMVHHDRFAEDRLFDAIVASAITANVAVDTTTLSATRDLLNHLDLVSWNIRTRHRLGRTFPFRVILPEIALGVMRTDIARSMPGGSFAENLNVAEATLNTFFTSRNLNVTWSPDLIVQDAPADGVAIDGWPTTLQYALYPEGTFLHLDAGELDLGVVRDSSLNETNDFETFAESFEALHPLGVEAVAGTIDVCPTGAVSGTEDLSSICGTGS